LDDFMADDTTRLIMFAADQVLDDAWEAQFGVSAALAVAKGLSAEVGREPLIEDAKLLIAGERNCSPSEAFDLLASVSKRHNIKVAAIARRLMESHSAGS
jgi:AmiR/NasT family two-component response regulator